MTVVVLKPGGVALKAGGAQLCASADDADCCGGPACAESCLLHGGRCGWAEDEFGDPIGAITVRAAFTVTRWFYNGDGSLRKTLAATINQTFTSPAGVGCNMTEKFANANPLLPLVETIDGSDRVQIWAVHAGFSRMETATPTDYTHSAQADILTRSDPTLDWAGQSGPTLLPLYESGDQTSWVVRDALVASSGGTIGVESGTVTASVVEQFGCVQKHTTAFNNLTYENLAGGLYWRVRLFGSIVIEAIDLVEC